MEKKTKDLMLGSGKAKICIPLLATTEPTLRQEADEAKAAAADMVEWRADKYSTDELSDLLRVLSVLRQDMAEVPLLFTYRNKREGGDGNLLEENYRELLSSVIRSKMVDLIDIEFSCEEGTIQALIKDSKSYGVVTVLSSHRFDDTPSQKEMEEILERMIGFGADLPKLAVMAVQDNDVLRLLAATDRISKKHGNMPLIAISMGEKGRLSRIAGSQFGSCITFAAGNEPSAPGQIQIEQLRNVLSILSF